MQLAARHTEAADFVIGSGVVHTVRDFVAVAFAAAGVNDWEDRVVLDASFVRPADPLANWPTAHAHATYSAGRPRLGLMSF